MKKLSSFLKLGLISLGIAIPSSLTVLAVNSFATGLIISIVFKRREAKLISLISLIGLFLLISFKNSWQIKTVFLFLFLGLTGLLFASLIKSNLRPLSLLFFLSLSYLLIALVDGKSIRQVVQHEPIDNNYTTDMACYLKTYFLVEKGMPFYQAYATGEIGEASTDDYPGEIWGWKTPFLFYLWKIFPGRDGRTIYWLLTSLVLSTPFITYLIAKELVGKNLASLSSFLIWPYFLLPLKEIFFIQVEWWALIFFLTGFYFLIKEKFFWTTLFFSLTLFSRELFAVHLFSLLVVLFLIKKKRMCLSLLLPFLFILLFYALIHVPQVGKYENLKNLNSWWRETRKTNNVVNSWPYVRTTLAFNSWQYLLFSFFPFRISLISSFFSLIYLYLRKKKAKYLLSLASFLLFFLFQFKPGLMTLYHEYWGVYYVPTTLICCPAIIESFRKRGFS